MYIATVIGTSGGLSHSAQVQLRHRGRRIGAKNQVLSFSSVSRKICAGARVRHESGESERDTSVWSDFFSSSFSILGVSWLQVICALTMFGYRVEETFDLPKEQRRSRLY